ncbi:hypothetical protein TNCV_3614811 [Trichonephila clavipes]|nr:hypothetical protein TNCV_3614811 [Trichonephila clavipes]
MLSGLVLRRVMSSNLVPLKTHVQRMDRYMQNMSRLNRPFVAVVRKLGEGCVSSVHHLGSAFLIIIMGCGRHWLKVSDHDRHAISLSPVPLKIRLLWAAMYVKSAEVKRPSVGVMCRS